MPIPQSEIDRVLDENEADGLGLPASRFKSVRQRYTVAKTRRLMMRYEDHVIIRINDIWRDSLPDITSAVAGIPEGIDTKTKEYTDAVLKAVTPRLDQLGRDTAEFMYQRMSVSYALSQVLGTWQLNQSFDDDEFVPPEIDWADIGESVLTQARDEADMRIYDLLGEDWREEYGDQIDDLVVNLRKNMNSVIGQDKGVRDVMKSIRDTMGIDIKKRTARAAFFKTTVIARSHTISTNVNAALASYREYPDVINKMEWIATNDSRTCPICRPLDGESWPIDSSSLMRPVSDTHPQCRCDLIPLYERDPAAGNPTKSAKEYFDTNGNGDLYTQLQPKNWD